MMNHLSYPYPNKSDCEELEALTGLSHKQIRVWCTNTRKRRLNVSRSDYSFNSYHAQIMQHEANRLYGKLLTFYSIAKYVTPLQQLSVVPEMRVTDCQVVPNQAVGTNDLTMLLKYMDENYCSCEFSF